MRFQRKVAKLCAVGPDVQKENFVVIWVFISSLVSCLYARASVDDAPIDFSRMSFAFSSPPNGSGSLSLSRLSVLAPAPSKSVYPPVRRVCSSDARKSGLSVMYASTFFESSIHCHGESRSLAMTPRLTSHRLCFVTKIKRCDMPGMSF